MTGFGALPFEDQLDRIDAAARDGDVRAVLREAAASPDAEPLGRLLDACDRTGRLVEIEAELASVFASLPDPALQHLFTRAAPPAVAALLDRLAADALARWPLERVGALSFLSRISQARAPARHAALLAGAESRLERPGDERWLLFASGRRLAELAAERATRDWVANAIERVIETLARAPKSISQANAERLLASRVYADPGHFFFELLQNADDAGATSWRASIDRDRVILSHDGAPFSLLDLVGVLSIGQTTKRIDQIGFFGVGFKSVYEICERPRIHSGALSFEIAHVSIPRRIASEVEEGQTTLVLPFARAFDAAALHRRALAIPPETLMTLSNVRALAVRGPGGPAREWRTFAEGRATILERDRGIERRVYRTAEGTVRYEGARPEGKPHESRVLVSVALDGAAPAPLDGPTIYAFLPTAERSGLRFFVHARFDVTLDRERLETSSDWNDSLLAEAGRVLGRLVIALAREGSNPLPVLSSPSEIAPSVSILERSFAASVRDRPCLFDAAGALVAPVNARIASPSLARALAGVDLDGGRVLGELDARETEVALSLGAARFDTDALAAWLSRTLTTGSAPPAWLAPPVLEAIAGASPDELASIAFLVDGSGRLASPAIARVGSPAQADLYAGLAPVVSSDSIAGLPARLRQRVVFSTFEPETLVRDLRDPSTLEALAARGDRLFDAIAELPDELLSALDEVALYPTSLGRRARAGGVVRLAPRLSALGRFLASRVPILDEPFATRHPTLSARAFRSFDLDSLARHLAEGASIDDPGPIGALLDREAADLPRVLAMRFGALALFRDRHGVARPLVGRERALVAHPATPSELLPSWPWTAPRPFLEAIDLARVDATALARALAGEPEWLPIPPSDLEPVQAFVGSHAGELPRAVIEALASAPIWLDAGARPRSLGALRRGSSSDAIEVFYLAHGARHVAARSTLELLHALGADARVPATDHEAAMLDLLAGAAVPRPVAAAVMNEATGVDAKLLASVAAAPIFADEAGVLRPLGSWQAREPQVCLRAGTFAPVLRAAGIALLSRDDEALFAGWLRLAGPPPASPADVARLAPDLVGSEELAAFLRAHAAELDLDTRASIARLPIFRSLDGERRPASELTDSELFRSVLGAARLRSLDLEGALLDPRDRSLADSLGAELHPARALLEQRVLHRWPPDAPLADRPAPFATRADLAALRELARRTGVDLDASPLTLSSDGRVVRGPLLTASAAGHSLLARLPLGRELADAEFVALLSKEHTFERLPGRRVAEALRAACPVELPRASHPVIGDLAALYAWLRDEAPALDADALGALGAAAIFPSQRDTLRPARALVLDPTLPDVGLGWGLAPDVPSEVAAWLRGAFEMERSARDAIVEHVLDGVDEAAERDDRLRAGELVSFLASALGAGDLPFERLEERVRRSGVRARLKVPVEGGAWTKPRFAWMPSDDVAERARAFALDLPPRIDFEETAPAVRALLAAAGARADLDEEAVDRCLSGRELRSGLDARIALARYTLERTLAAPRRRERWKLGERAWVPTTAGVLRRPGDLLFPDELARALLGDDDERFPHPEVVAGLSSDAAARIGFASVAALPLERIVTGSGAIHADSALVEWLESGLRTGRFAPATVRALLGERLLLTDDEGASRPAAELAEQGARALFGPWRGDLPRAREFPKLARALDIPSRPHAAMIALFLTEIGARLATLTGSDRDLLVHVVPACFERLEELADRRPLAKGAAIAGVRGGRVALARIGDPAVVMLEPPSLADAIDAEAYLDPLPIERGDALLRRLWASGVPDLRARFEIAGVRPAAPMGWLDPRAEALRQRLVAALGPGFARRARAVEAIEIDGVLDASGRRIEVAAHPVCAAISNGTLFVTETGLDRPLELAADLVRDPIARASLVDFLENDRSTPSRAVRRGAEPTASSTRSFFDRLGRFFGGAVDEETATAPPAPPSAPARPRRDDRFFRPDASVRAQLDRTDGWLESRREVPDFGFAFAPRSLDPPWVYAPKTIVTRFDRRSQRWDRARLPTPVVRGEAGLVAMNGRLPAGESVLPVPHYGRLVQIRVSDGHATIATGAHGETLARLSSGSAVRLRIALASMPSLERASVARIDALGSFVPDDELPDEAHDLVASARAIDDLAERAWTIRDFVRSRYRYDPTYLEDARVGQFLARITQGRANAHVAALHAARDATHLGAGVCYELNSLACELLRRAGIAAGLAVGWVLRNGALSEPDHLWSIAFLEDAHGAPLWLVVDASSTRDGRPLRVPPRPPGRFRPVRDREAKAPPPAPRFELDDGARARRPKRKRPPYAELHRVLGHLGETSGAPVAPADRKRLEDALGDPEHAAKLLARLLDR